MTSSNRSGSTALDFGDGLDDADARLQFQTFEHAPADQATATTHTFQQVVPDSAVDGDDDRERLLPGDDDDDATPAGNYNFWSIDFYRRFFDVDTTDVTRRILWSMLPNVAPGKDFLTDKIRPKPDLYGPFWICATLVISIAVTGNVASYLQTSFTGEASHWHYDFHKVTLAATTVFSYACFMPAAIYAFLWWSTSPRESPSAAAAAARPAPTAVSFLELLCLYGYSLAIYVPVSVLWIIQVSALQWSLVLVGAGLSGGVLVLALYPVLRRSATRGAVLLLAVIIAVHALLACGFMLYFFHVPETAAAALAHDADAPTAALLPPAAVAADAQLNKTAAAAAADGSAA